MSSVAGPAVSSGTTPAKDTVSSGESTAPAGSPGVSPGLVEVLVVWAICGAVLVGVFVTYARVPVADLYHVSRGGLSGGAGRALIAVNFPMAMIAIPLLGIAVARLVAHPWAAARARRWSVIAVSLAALVLCAVAAWPGVVREDALDARPVNTLPAIGVGLVMALTVLTIRVCGVGQAARPDPWSGARIAVVAALLVAGLPWAFADAGYYISDVPVLGAIFVARELLPSGETLAAVHLGHHHGADGVLFAVSALLLSRTLGSVGGSRLRALLCFALALMFVYGVALVANDLWGEQVVKRGWTSVGVPSVLRPAVTPAWGVVLAVTVMLHLLMMRALRPRPASPPL